MQDEFGFEIRVEIARTSDARTTVWLQHVRAMRLRETSAVAVAGLLAGWLCGACRQPARSAAHVSALV